MKSELKTEKDRADRAESKMMGYVELQQASISAQNQLKQWKAQLKVHP